MQQKNDLPSFTGSGLSIGKKSDSSLLIISKILEEGNPEYWYEKASIAKEHKNWQAAFYFYSKAIQLNNKENKYLIPNAYCAMKINKSEIAANALIQAFKSKKDWEIWKDFETYLNSDEWLELKNHFKLLNSNQNRNTFIIALIEVTCKKFESALRILNSLRNNQRILNSDYYELKGSINLGLFNFEETIKDYEAWIALEPKNPRAYYCRGFVCYHWVFREAEELNIAIKAYTTCIEFDPGYANAYFLRAETYYDLGKFELAIDDYITYLGFDPKCNLAYFKRGCAYNEIKKFTCAIKDFTIHIELESQFKPAYFERGDCYYELEEFELAINDYSAHLKLYPKNPISYFKRGKIYYESKEFTLAIHDFTKAIEFYSQFRLLQFSYPHLLTEAQTLLQNSKQQLELLIAND